MKVNRRLSFFAVLLLVMIMTIIPLSDVIAGVVQSVTGAATTIEPPRQDSPIEWAAKNLRILNKKFEIIPLNYNRVQRHYLANRTSRDLVLKSRQQGLSTAIQAELFRAAVTSTAVTMTLAHDDDTTQKLRRMADRYYENMPDKPLRKYANNVVTSYPMTNSEANIATAGGKNKGRGGTYSHFHGSEVAFWLDAEAIIAGAMQGGDPAVTLESTPNGAQGYFYTLCMEALDGNSDWRLHFFPWWWDSEYKLPILEGEVISYTDDEMALVVKHNLTPEQIKWRRSKQRELKHLFPQEYPEDPLSCFLQSGFGYFGDISHAWTAPLNPTWDRTHRYVAGLDFGQKDYTALNIIDATAMVEVATLRVNKLLWREMRRQVIAMCKYWHVTKIIAEANSMGRTNIEAMREEMREAYLEALLVEFWTDNASKSAAASSLHESLHSPGGLRLQSDPVQKHEMNAFIATQTPSGLWHMAGKKGENDDTVIARILAYYGVKSGNAVVVDDQPSELAEWRG